MDSNLGDAVILRQIALMAADDHRRILLWSAAMRGTAQVLRWQSADLRGRAVAAQASARAARERAAIAQASARALQAGAPQHRCLHLYWQGRRDSAAGPA